NKLASLFFAALVSMFATATLILGATINPPRPQTHQPLTKTDIDRMMTELSNWGRWGKDDQLGAMNLITPAKRKQAALLVTEGVSVSLAHDVEKERAADNSNPFQHTMTLTGANPASQFSLDAYSVNYHGYAHTHLDALCHVFYKGKMYNGFSQEEVTQKGAARLSILNLKQGIFTRGILIDVARLKGVPYL